MISLLPKYLLLSILKEWLLISEVGRLDTSICSHAYRSIFNAILFNCDLTFSHQTQTKSEANMIAWIVSHKINVDMVNLNERTSEKPSINDLLKNHIFKSLKVICITCGPGYKSFTSLVSQSPDLEQLELLGNYELSVQTVNSILKSITSSQLKVLVIDGLKSLNHNLHVKILNSCKSLTDLTISCQHTTLDAVEMLVKTLFNAKLLKFQWTDCSVKVFFDVEVFSVIMKVLSKTISVFHLVDEAENEARPFLTITRNYNHNVIADSLIATTRLPSIQYLTAGPDIIPNYILENYKSSSPIELSNINCDNKVTSLELRNCECYEFVKCKNLVGLNAHMSQLVGSANVLDNNFPDLCNFFVTSTTMFDAENWIRFVVTRAPKLSTISVLMPQDEIKQLSSDIVEELAALGCTVSVSGSSITNNE